MRYISTNNPDGPSFGLAEALRLGPAPDGGLFLPERIVPLADDFWRELPGRPRVETAEEVMHAFVEDALEPAVLHEICRDALDFPLPLRRVTDHIALLELFHGPTLAFKDVGARFLARLLPATAQGAETATVLVATSGDTGGAVAQAFHGVEGTRVVILYPEGQVSPVQERQFTTLGGNVRALAVDGTFDDCQRLVKEAFADRRLARGVGLTSANSINLGRLLPQAIYYVHAAGRVGRVYGEKRPLLFVVPSGNFGDLTAGLLAHRLGLDHAFGTRFVAATNANDMVPRYLESGLFEPRKSVRTISNAMDVGDPSNLARIRHLYGDDVEALRRDVSAHAYDDEETKDAIARVDREHGVVLDPHTAVGWCAAEDALEERRPEEEDDDVLAIVLATAHPAKFAESVEPAIGRKIDLPERLARHLEKPVRSERLRPEIGELADKLTGG